jgi:hypothetical protein
VIAGSAVAALVVGIVLWGFTRGAARPAATASQSNRAVDLIPMAAHATEPPPARAIVDDPEIEMTPDDPPAAGDHAAKDGSAVSIRRPVPDVAHRPIHRDPRSPPAAPAAPAAVFTREQLGQKFQQVRREYDAYKAKFGSRLEREWGELATSIQYMPATGDDAGRKEAARKLDEFRARMRE